MFRVKICGVRVRDDVQAVGRCGGDAIGFNFYSPSIRYVDPSDPAIRELSDLAAELGILRVGVFVNESPDRIAQIVQAVGLDVIQLHGDETIEEADAIAGVKIRAIKLATGPLKIHQIDDASRDWICAGYHLLLDACAGAAHGGSGKTLDWPSIAAWANQNPSVTWTLAGGLVPENVAVAMRTSSATSVDTAGGVESPKGTKSPARIAQFIAAQKFGSSE